jgi:thiamine kinase
MAAAVSGIDPAGLRKQALACVPGCETGAPPIAVAPLRGGTSNATFHVKTRLGSFVMRLHASESPVFGVDRNREAVLHAAAARAGIAPAIVHADAAGRFLITEYIGGEPWTAESLERLPELDRLAALLKQLHAVEPPAVTPLDIRAVLHRLMGKVLEADNTERSWLEALAQRADQQLRAGSVRAPAITHTDLYHSNILSSGRRLYLVDWEYAAVSDPMFDLGCLVAYYPGTAMHAARLLERSGLSDHASVDELVQAAWLYTLLSYLWYRARRLSAPASRQDLDAEQDLRARLVR